MAGSVQSNFESFEDKKQVSSSLTKENWPSIDWDILSSRSASSPIGGKPILSLTENAEARKILAGCQLENNIKLPALGLTDLDKASHRTAETVALILQKKQTVHEINDAKVRHDMRPSVKDILHFGRTHDPGDKRLEGYLTAQTTNPPGNQDCYAANVTKPYEEQAMKTLEKLAAEHKHISQKELVALVANITPDQDTAVLTLANLTKNLAALHRGAMQKDKGDGTTESGVKYLKNRNYTASDAEKVVNALDPVNSGSDKMGCMYHFYGALSASYFLGVAGKGMVEIERYTHHDPQKQAANRGGEEAADRLRHH